MEKKIFLIKKNYTSRKWTRKEDKLIIETKIKNVGRKWKLLSKFFNNKTPIQCYLRSKILDPLTKKGKFSHDEDENLLRLVEQYGHSWSFISKFFKNRNSKQLRVRFSQHLNKSLSNAKFTYEEDEIILDNYKNLKNKWSAYTKLLTNRSSIKIKTRYFSLMRKMIKKSSLKNVGRKRNSQFENQENTYNFGSKINKHENSTINYFFLKDFRKNSLNDMKYEDDYDIGENEIIKNSYKYDLGNKKYEYFIKIDDTFIDCSSIKFENLTDSNFGNCMENIETSTFLSLDKNCDD